jgi:broad specificity phosphatase PhoE
MDHSGVQRWRRDYDATGIRLDGSPPAALLELAESASIVTSDLPRAVESAERLAPRRSIRQSALLREAHLEIPAWPTRLPLEVWAFATHLAWMYRILRGADASESDLTRAAAAAELVTRMVADGSTALVVTHGVFRRLLGRELLGRGWTSLGRRGGYRHWSAWSFAGPIAGPPRGEIR